MPEVKWQARRVSDGVLVDVTGDISGTPESAPTANVLEGVTNPLLAPFVIAPTTAATGLTVKNENNFAVLLAGGTAEGVAVLVQGPGTVGAGNTIFQVNDETDDDLFVIDSSAFFGFRIPASATSGGLWVLFQNALAAPPFAIKNSQSGITVYRVDIAGRPIIRASAAPADGDLAANEMAIYFDATNGAAKLKIKGKSANGTVVNGEVALT